MGNPKMQSVRLIIGGDTSNTFEIREGESISGIGSEDGASLVTIKIYIDGELVFEDDIMEGELNEFEYEIPEGSKGKTIRVTAESSTGGYAEKTGKIH